MRNKRAGEGIVGCFCEKGFRRDIRGGGIDPTIAQMELFKNADKYEKKVYVLPKILDEKVARAHLKKIGVKLTRLTKEQAEYINVPVDGPYKPNHYRY